LYVPGATVASAFTVISVVAVLSEGGVTGLGLKLQPAPDGKPVQAISTVLLNPPIEVIVQMPVSLPPGTVLYMAGLHDTVKSGPEVTRNVILIEWLSGPASPLTVNG
jgi:hypothetical protein